MAPGSDVKLILLGESGVGKTSLLLRFKSGIFKESLQRTRIDYSEKVIKIRDKEIKIVVWDTAGQEIYNSLMRGYYNLADGVLLVYDVRNADTFMTLSKWLVQLKSKNEKAEVLIAGNKIEDRSKKAVTVSMVSNFARSEQLEHVGVSAKSGENVEILFHHLVMKILAARGIISYSKDQVLEKLEKSGEYLSPSTVVSEESSFSSETPGKTLTDSTVPISTDVQDHMGNYTTVIKDPRPGSASAELEENEHNSTHRIQVSEKDSASQESIYEIPLTAPDDWSGSIDVADCALEFFDELGEDTSSSESDTIKLHEEVSPVQRVEKGCCFI